jgi:CRP/FNR family cyclic AMP-dependent transcriptional regulator
MTSAELQRMPLFSSLSPDTLDAVRQLAVLRSYAKRTVIVSEDDPGDAVYVILSGKVKVYVSDEKGKQIDLGTQGPGEYFGEVILDGGPRAASVMTLEPSQLVVFSRADFEALVTRYPAIAMHIIQKLIHRVRAATANVKSLGLRDVYGRVVALLLDEAGEQNPTPPVSQKMTQQEIANRVGASREMVGRILRDLARGGYISIEAGRIMIIRKPPSGW